MIPNNIYYRRIAQILNNKECKHFHSTLFYLKRIAQSFGETYTGFNPSNKYLKDWAIARGVTDDGEHHINRYWLHKIALTYDNSTLAGKTDNYYLKIIYDKLSDEPRPVPTTFKTYINGVEVDNTQELPANIISYADSEYIDYKFVVLDENNDPLSGYNIPLSVGGSAVTPTPVTDSNGEVNYRYESSGVGDTNIYIDCTLVSKRYDIVDASKYIASGSHTFSSSSMAFFELFDAEGIGDCEISIKLKSANQKGFSLDYRKTNANTDNKSLVRVGVDGANYYFVIDLDASGTGNPQYPNVPYSTNTDLLCKIHRENGVWTATIGTYTYTINNIADLRYIGIMNWNNAKTIQYSDFIVKPL